MFNTDVMLCMRMIKCAEFSIPVEVDLLACDVERVFQQCHERLSPNASSMDLSISPPAYAGERSAVDHNTIFRSTEIAGFRSA
ncbi:hypothetical protein CSKR_114169 [Clonorchis sinensis]|uniref:Uncharacterized protein n=1 Tax=Clonorchis sinensis TaxID=79923 RepID=A0A419PUD0_CLOSI|nr:hypothetical protein CSKR_114169 [Clonorchis sinensis]